VCRVIFPHSSALSLELGGKPQCICMNVRAGLGWSSVFVPVLGIWLYKVTHASNCALFLGLDGDSTYLALGV
jgi:hypothetical protein